MRYSVAVPADQTVLLLQVLPNGKLDFIVDHSVATLFYTKRQLNCFLIRHGLKEVDESGEGDVYVEEVADEAEFRRRPDTW